MCRGLHWIGLDCGGKDTLLALYNKIKKHRVYSKAKTRFFIDRDFVEDKDLPVEADIYITPCYAVENLYVTTEAFAAILKNEFGFNAYPDDDHSFAISLALFSERLNEFLDAVQLLNAWIIFYRRKEAEEGEATVKLNLQSLRIDRWISVTLDAVRSNYTLSDLQSSVKGAHPVTEAELRRIISEFKPEQRYLHFRGKFQAYFLRAFLNKLSADANSKPPTHLPAHKHITFTVSDRTFLSDVCQYAVTPPCLERFLLALN